MLTFKLEIKNNFSFCCAKGCGKTTRDPKGKICLENELKKLPTIQQHFVKKALEYLHYIRKAYIKEENDKYASANEKCYCYITEMIYCIEKQYHSEFIDKIELYKQYVAKQNKTQNAVTDCTSLLYEIKGTLVDIDIIKLQRS